jgi:flagellar hook-length control protein FliK
VPTTVPLAQAPQLLAGKAEVTDDASAASASLLSMTATTHAERGTAALHRSTPRATPAQQLPAAGKLNAATLAQASHGAQPAAAAAAALTDKSAESARSSQFVTAVDRAGPDVSAFSGVQAMLGDSLNPAPQMRTQPKVDVAADTLLSPSDTAQVAIRQDFSALMPTGLSLAAASAPAAREAATEASLAVLGRGSLSEPRSSALAGLDAAQSGVFALPTAGAGVAVRGSEIPVPVQANVPTPFAEPGFQQALGYEVSLLARDGIGEAELHLNPADMGPVSVQITMTGDQARVDFGADLAQTRQALEAGWAELASSLKDAGFTLSGGGVSDHARGRQAQRSPAAPLSFGGRASLDSGVTSVMAPAVARRFNGTVDTYA